MQNNKGWKIIAYYKVPRGVKPTDKIISDGKQMKVNSPDGTYIPDHVFKRLLSANEIILLDNPENLSA